MLHRVALAGFSSSVACTGGDSLYSDLHKGLGHDHTNCTIWHSASMPGRLSNTSAMRDAVIAETPSDKVGGLHLAVVRDHDDHPERDCRRREASRQRLLPTGGPFASSLAPKECSTYLDASRSLVTRSRSVWSPTTEGHALFAQSAKCAH